MKSSTAAFHFLIAGSLNTSLSYGVYFLALQIFKYKYVTAYIISFMVGVAIALALNSKFVFHTRLTIKKCIWFVMFYCVQFILGITILQLLVDILHVHKMAAPLFSMLITVPLSFFMNRYALSQI